MDMLTYLGELLREPVNRFAEADRPSAVKFPPNFVLLVDFR